MKKYITAFTVSLVVLIFLACNSKKEKEQKKVGKEQIVAGASLYINLVNNEEARTHLWKAAIDSGDCIAYNKIAVAYLMTYREVELYYYSLIMANKYQCPEAYRNLSAILTHEASTGDMVLLSKDKNTQSLARYYLFKAKELGSVLAKKDIELEFGKEQPKQGSAFFLKQLMDQR